MVGSFRLHDATRLMARDAMPKDRKDRETEVREARGTVELFLSVFFSPEPRGGWKRK